MMKVFCGFDTLPAFVRPAVTVGSFDGVHLGHRALVERLVAEARAAGGESIVLTFEPHPRIVLGSGEGLRLLTTLPEKIGLLAGLGVDNVVLIPFDQAFSRLSGAEFVREYLIGRVGAETLVAGYNHRFGHDRIAGDALRIPGLRIVRVDERRVTGGHVSSTVIRRLVEAGDSAAAEQLLGHALHPAPTPFATIDPPRTEELVAALTALWRASVEATHRFLTPRDVERLLPEVRAGIGSVGRLVTLGAERPEAFMGIEGDRLEMLFVDPARFGQGLGRALIALATESFGVRRVDVNEQNPGAAAFYRRMGFETVGRTETDSAGRPFPLLHMVWNQTTKR